MVHYKTIKIELLSNIAAVYKKCDKLKGKTEEKFNQAPEIVKVPASHLIWYEVFDGDTCTVEILPVNIFGYSQENIMLSVQGNSPSFLFSLQENNDLEVDGILYELQKLEKND